MKLNRRSFLSKNFQIWSFVSGMKRKMQNFSSISPKILTRVVKVCYRGYTCIVKTLTVEFWVDVTEQRLNDVIGPPHPLFDVTQISRRGPILEKAGFQSSVLI